MEKNQDPRPQPAGLLGTAMQTNEPHFSKYKEHAASWGPATGTCCPPESQGNLEAFLEQGTSGNTPEVRKGSEAVNDKIGRGIPGHPTQAEAQLRTHSGPLDGRPRPLTGPALSHAPPPQAPSSHRPRPHRPRPLTGPILSQAPPSIAWRVSPPSPEQGSQEIKGCEWGAGASHHSPVTTGGAALPQAPELSLRSAGCLQAPPRPQVTPLPALGHSHPPILPGSPPRPGDLPLLHLAGQGCPPCPPRHQARASAQADPDVGRTSTVQGAPAPGNAASGRQEAEALPRVRPGSWLLRGVCLFS